MTEIHAYIRELKETLDALTRENPEAFIAHLNTRWHVEEDILHTERILHLMSELESIGYSDTLSRPIAAFLKDLLAAWKEGRAESVQMTDQEKEDLLHSLRVLLDKLEDDYLEALEFEGILVRNVKDYLPYIEPHTKSDVEFVHGIIKLVMISNEVKPGAIIFTISSAVPYAWTYKEAYKEIFGRRTAPCLTLNVKDLRYNEVSSARRDSIVSELRNRLASKEEPFIVVEEMVNGLPQSGPIKLESLPKGATITIAYEVTREASNKQQVIPFTLSAPRIGRVHGAGPSQDACKEGPREDVSTKYFAGEENAKRLFENITFYKLLGKEIGRFAKRRAHQGEDWFEEWRKSYAAFQRESGYEHPHQIGDLV